MLEKENSLTTIGKNIPESKQEVEEDILEVIYQWHCEGIKITKRRIANYFGLSKHEVTYYARQMVNHGYIIGPHNEEELKLTEFGKVQGEECHYRHTTLTQFLQMLGLDKNEAQEDACRIEHIVGEKTVKGITNFMLNGDIYERSFTGSNLRYHYDSGEYHFLMGIYSMDDRYPRQLAEEFRYYLDTVILSVKEEESGFFLLAKEGKPDWTLWYKSKDEWVKAEARGQGEWLPAQAFEFTIAPRDPITEGYLLVAFMEDDEEPNERKCRELNVHIW